MEAGLAPLAAIKAATLDAARVLTRSENPNYRSLRAGKITDLVIVDADPTVDIRNLHRVHKVMRAGQWTQ